MTFGSSAAPQPAPVVPTREDPAIEEARRRELVSARKSRGRAASILTSGQGVPGAAPTAAKQLLGQ